MSELGRVWAITLVGLKGHAVEVQSHLANGLPGFSLVGLPDTSLRESKERVRAALTSCGINWPEKRCTINLSPANLPKSGSGFDLAIAVSLAVAGSETAALKARNCVFLGELGLDGALHPVRGILPAVAAAKAAGFKRVFVPRQSVAEASLVSGMQVGGAAHLAEVLTDLGIPCTGVKIREDLSVSPSPKPSSEPVLDLADVRGQIQAREALEVAAAGGHHLFLLGVPGAGKTMLASRLPGILPDLDDEAAVQVTSLHSLAGTFDASGGLIRRPPFVAPHHGASAPALLGGGTGIARPGAVSLAHNGVLFLDEAPEFSARVLDGLRQPLEQGSLTIYRSRAAVHLPARFQLVMAANPCPCGQALTAGGCTCSSLQKRRYMARLSGPLLDRVDIHCQLYPPSRGALAADIEIDDTATVARRVQQARQVAQHRWNRYPWSLNSTAPGPFLRSKQGGYPRSLQNELDSWVEKGRLTMRGADRVMKLSWTLADLHGHTVPNSEDVYQAMTLRAGSGK